jgi:hypothetical protein
MSNIPILGCLNEKFAGAYLIRPTVKPKKKKKKKKQNSAQSEELDKLASAIAEQSVISQQIVMQKKLQSGNLGGGWNPFDQLIDKNS